MLVADAVAGSGADGTFRTGGAVGGCRSVPAVAVDAESGPETKLQHRPSQPGHRVEAVPQLEWPRCPGHEDCSRGRRR